MRGVRTTLSQLTLGLSMSALSAGLMPAAALAQAPEETAAPENEDVADAGAQMTPIVVTGTRIERIERITPNPVVSYSEETIELSGETDLAELLSQSPALYASQAGFDSTEGEADFGGSGLDLLDLRNLGVDRTLVLVNGRRHVGSLAGVASVDINTIPNSLVERVDILTGGASAIYGADGVSGVVNFITRRDFEGVSLNAQQGISDEGDAPSTLVSAAVGSNFADGRGNIALAYDYRHKDSLAFTDRDFGSARLISNPADAGGDDPNIPDYILANDVRYFGSSPNGAVIIDPSFFPVFDGNGDPFDAGALAGGGPYGLYPSNTAVTIGGSGTSLDAYAGNLQPEKDAHVANLLGHFDITPSLTLFAEAKYARSETYSESSPSFTDPPIFISAAESVFFPFAVGNNPFIPDAIRAAVAPDNFFPATGVFITRDNFDLGRFAEDTTRDTYRGVIGLEGDLKDNLRFELSYVYGRTDVTVSNENYLIADRYFAAIDAVDEGEYLTGTANGNIVCLSDLEPGDPINPLNFGGPATTFTPGSGACQPLNLFGNGSPSQAAIDWVTTDLVNKSRLQQHVVNGYISGDLGNSFALPGGPVGFAVGAEYRSEKSHFEPDPLIAQDLLLDLQSLNAQNDGFDVVEIFGETTLPILADMPGAYRLQLDAAVRHADYSTVGGTTSWKLGGLYAPIPDVTFRGTYAHAVRAPNIAEFFTSPLNNTASLGDPCALRNRDSGTSAREANCAALLSGLGVDPTTFNPFGSTVAGIVRGNPDLDEERARTWTLGALVEPQMLPGLSLSLDWYDIRIKDAVIQTSPQQFVNLCVDQTSIDNVFCANVERDAITGEIAGFTTRPYNISSIETAGLDISLSYSFAPDGWGAFNVRGTLGYLDKLVYENAPGATEDRQGVLGAPEWVGTGDITWRKGNVLINYGINYVGEQSYFSKELLEAQPDIAPQSIIDIEDAITHDLRAEFITDGGMSFYVGANNVTDEKPEAPLVSSPVSYLGRYFYAGVKVDLDTIGF